MPRLWNETIASHRHDVREACLDAAAVLVAEHGLRSVTMSQISEATGIGRATIYKYFPSADAILVAWHERQVARHLEQLVEARDRADGPPDRLMAVLETYALISHDPAGGELASLLHRGEHVVQAHGKIGHLMRDLLVEGAAAGEVRLDVTPDELASYCLHALGAAGELRSKAAVRRLVAVTLTGLSPRSS